MTECRWVADSSLLLFFSTPGPVPQSWATVSEGSLMATSWEQLMHYGPKICFHFSAALQNRQISITPVFPWHMANLECSLLFIGNPKKTNELFSLKHPCILRIPPGTQAFIKEVTLLLSLSDIWFVIHFWDIREWGNSSFSHFIFMNKLSFPV